MRGFGFALVALMLLVALDAPRAQSPIPDDLAALSQRAVELYRAGRFTDAIEIKTRSLAVAERLHGPDHLSVGTELHDLAVLYRAQGRLAEAEPLAKRALAITEQVLGPDHGLVSVRLNNLAALYERKGQLAAAEALATRSVAIAEKAPSNDPILGYALNLLALVYERQGRLREAEPLYKRTLAVWEKVLGPDHHDVGAVLGNLASVYRAQGKYADAEPLYQRALAVNEKAFGPEHFETSIALNNLGGVYRDQGRFAEAEILSKRAVAIAEKTLGGDHPHVATLLGNLAKLHSDDGRQDQAEPLSLRALAIAEKALGPNSLEVAKRLSQLADIHRDRGRSGDAERLYQRALAIREQTLGPDHLHVGEVLNNLALLHTSQGRFAEAEPLLKRDLAIIERTLGPDHPEAAASGHNLGALYVAEGRYADAEPLYRRSLAIREKRLGPEHPAVVQSVHNLANLHFLRGDWAGAAELWRRSTSVLMRSTERGSAHAGQRLTGKKRTEVERGSYQFWRLVKAMRRQPAAAHYSDAVAKETFETAQWALSSEAATSLAQMAARGSSKDPALGVLVRERQDLVSEWERRDAARTAALSKPAGTRDALAEAASSAWLVATEERIARIDQRLAVEFPDYAALVRSNPLSVEEVQAQLWADEVLILFLDTPDWRPTPEETFIWAVTKTDIRWVRSDLGTGALTGEVAALRCGLDAAPWDDEDRGRRCREVLKAEPQRDVQGNVSSETLPFAWTRAHDLYSALFGQIEDLIRDKHLLIVPSGPLTQLPFHVLVTAPHSDQGDYRGTKWLARQNAITVLPAVSSLKALRRVAKTTSATKPMLGVGNPLLDGNPSERPWEAKWAQLAREKQACPQTMWQRLAGLVDRRRDVQKVVMRGGRADLDHLRSQSPLHDTADELCATARDLRLASDDVVLGARATEAALKKLSSEGKLAQYRVLHFATHGTVAGEIEGTNEPGLILTPPMVQSDEDDGYLSASEVAALKLDADWVILSACNTAAGGALGAEALSGLARAFIYAGARALLVSHWAVSSDATVSLITHAVGAISRDKRLGRAEALRRAMLAMIDKGKPHEAHPAYWAPFVVVGEGAARWY